MSDEKPDKPNLLVTLLKKSVGMPTGGSSCCGAPALSAEVASGQGARPAAEANAQPGQVDAAPQGQANAARPQGSSGCCGSSA